MRPGVCVEWAVTNTRCPVLYSIEEIFLVRFSHPDQPKVSLLKKGQASLDLTGQAE
jgi:hypothetical protein